MHKVDDLMEPIYSHDKNHSVEPFVSISKSSPLIAAEHLQCESKAEDLLKRSFMICKRVLFFLSCSYILLWSRLSAFHGINFYPVLNETANQCGECTPKAVESIYASSNALISSTELKSKRASVSLHSDPPKSHSKSSAGVSAINSATLTVHKTTEKSLSSSKMRRCSSLRNISLISATSRARGSLPSKKGSLTDMHTVTNSHAKYGPVSTPVIVPRDALAQTTIGKETTTTRTSHLTESCMPIHLQKPSLNDANDSSEGSMVNCGSAEEDEKDHARNISGNFERIMTLDPSLELKDDKCTVLLCLTSVLDKSMTISVLSIDH